MTRFAQRLNRVPMTRSTAAILLILAVGLGAPQTADSANFVYVDADPISGTPNIEPLAAIHLGAFVGDDHLWGLRQNFAAEATVYESGFDEDSPELTQTISGLTPGTSYDMYVAFWVGDATSSADWQIYAGLEPSNGDLANHLRFNRSGPTETAPDAIAAVLAETLTWDVPPKNLNGDPLFHEGNRDMRLGFLGAAVADEAGQVLVYVNDNPFSTTTFRTWFDGVAYAVSEAAVPGDFDGDGDVDGADFVAWQTHFPTATGATLADGDADVDGDVDGADFVIWQTNFPFTPGSGAAPVPEPCAWLLMATAAGLLTLPLRRKRVH